MTAGSMVSSGNAGRTISKDDFEDHRARWVSSLTN
jgi:hypothetical protein